MKKLLLSFAWLICVGHSRRYRFNPDLISQRLPARATVLKPSRNLLQLRKWLFGGAPRVDLRCRPVSCTAETMEKLSNEVSLKRLSMAFKEADRDGNGLDREEFSKALYLSGATDLSEDEIDILFEREDVDGDKIVTYDEFLAPRAVTSLTCQERKQVNQTVIQPYHGDAGYLWRLWKGTIIAGCWKWALASVFYGLFIVILVRLFEAPTWPLGHCPDPKHPFIALLLPIAGLWEKELTLCTFVVTFFVRETLTFWRTQYANSRGLGARLTNCNMLLAKHAARDSSGALTDAAKSFLTDVARNSRLLHVLHWAGVSKRHNSVNSRPGLKRLCDQGYCTTGELESLLKLNPSDRIHAIFMWIITAGDTGRASGALVDDGKGGFSRVWNELCLALRAAYGIVQASLVARMPLVYLHLVQILVDTFLLLTLDRKSVV